MVQIKNKTMTVDFNSANGVYLLSGKYSYDVDTKEIKTYNVDINEQEGRYKGNSYLRDGVLKYNFSDVAADEMAAIFAACEACFGEVNALIVE